MEKALQYIITQNLSHLFPDINNFSITPGVRGSINETYRINFPDNAVFCKVNSTVEFPQLFQKEMNGLDFIRRQDIIKVPEAIRCFEEEGKQFLILEWIQEGERTEGFWKKFGEQLAHLHKITNISFGLKEDNYMGSVPQSNKLTGTWSKFFIDERLRPLVNKCLSKKLLSGLHSKQFQILYNRIPQIFEEEPPSLLHGDLWSGNFMCDENSEPVLIDPAVYFGHRSVDLGMTTLFGGFDETFYDAYHYHFPFPNNEDEQWEICNLYPLLIHLYLFGGSYLPQIERILKRFA